MHDCTRDNASQVTGKMARHVDSSQVLRDEVAAEDAEINVVVTGGTVRLLIIHGGAKPER